MTELEEHPEAAALLGSLRAQRRHVLGILEGLDDEALRRPVLPSGWTALGLVQHLTLDVERFWFRGVVAGDPAVVASVDDADDAWQVGPDVPASAVLDAYRRETEAASAVLAASPPDAALAWWPQQLFGDPWMHDVRAVALHVIAETACHAGHLDAARELLDGTRWLVLTE